MTSIPTALKTITPYIQRANELTDKAPMVAYYCRSYALELGIGLAKDEESKKYLISMMDRLENDKKALNPNPDEGKAVVEIFALKMFKKADDGDRAGNYTASIAKLYYASSILMQATKQFGEMSEDIDEKLQYAKWRAAEISKSLKTGIPPTAPPGSEEPQQEDDFNPISQQEHVDEAFSKQIFEKKQNSFNDPFFSNDHQQTQPQTTKEEDDFFSSVQPPQSQQNNDFFDVNPQQDSGFNDDFFGSAQPDNESKDVPKDTPKFPPKNEKPLSPPKSNFNDDFFSGIQPPQNDVQPKDDFFGSVKPNNQNFEQPKESKTTPQLPFQPTNVQPVAQNSQSIVQQEFVLKRHNIPNEDASMDDILKAQKYAKYVVSSLQFPDVPTAVKYLEDALALLVKK
eukprot:gene3499-6147_t